MEPRNDLDQRVRDFNEAVKQLVRALDENGMKIKMVTASLTSKDLETIVWESHPPAK